MIPLAEIIRALREHYPETYDLNFAVNGFRRAHGSKNYDAAARGLLKELQG